ncbi:MAG TPA: kelch repeat-containing protein [Planctomycetota bacterium]
MPMPCRLLPIVCLAAATASQERWQPMPKAPIAPRHGATLHRVGTDLVVFGGSDVPNAHTDLRLDGAVFDTKRSAWHALPDAPVGERRGALVVPVARGLYVAGGEDRWYVIHGEGAVLDVEKRQWRAVPKWPVAPRMKPSWSADGDLIALFGGYVAKPRPGETARHDHECFADGVIVDTAAGTVRAIPKGPLSARMFASVHLHSGKLLVVGGHTLSDRSIVQPLHDAAVFDLASGAWTKLDAAPVRGQSHLQFAALGGKVFAAGRESSHGLKAIATIWDPANGACAAVPGTDALVFRLDTTRLFAGSARALVWNEGLDLGDDVHQALWFAPDGWTPLPLPKSVRARQAAALAQLGDDVVMFGGNHEVGMATICATEKPKGPPPFTGEEGDGLHLNLATGEVAVIPQGPLAPRGRPLAAIAGDRLWVMWGTVGHELLADGASYRLR